MSKKVLLTGELRAEELIMNISSEMKKLYVLNNDILENFFDDSYTVEELKNLIVCKFDEFKTKAEIVQDYIYAVKNEVAELVELQEVTANV